MSVDGLGLGWVPCLCCPAPERFKKKIRFESFAKFCFRRSLQNGRLSGCRRFQKPHLLVEQMAMGISSGTALFPPWFIFGKAMIFCPGVGGLLECLVVLRLTGRQIEMVWPASDCMLDVPNVWPDGSCVIGDVSGIAFAGGGFSATSLAWPGMRGAGVIWMMFSSMMPWGRMGAGFSVAPTGPLQSVQKAKLWDVILNVVDNVGQILACCWKCTPFPMIQDLLKFIRQILRLRCFQLSKSVRSRVVPRKVWLLGGWSGRQTWKVKIGTMRFRILDDGGNWMVLLLPGGSSSRLVNPGILWLCTAIAASLRLSGLCLTVTLILVLLLIVLCCLWVLQPRKPGLRRQLVNMLASPGPASVGYWGWYCIPASPPSCADFDADVGLNSSSSATGGTSRAFASRPEECCETSKNLLCTVRI